MLRTPENASNDPMADRTLIVVQMAGGNDGLNTVVPYADGNYYSQRKNLGIPEAEVHKLDDRFGLHPSMAGFKHLWDDGKLAVVHGVGYPNPSFSHFKSMDIYQTANPEGRADEGWLAKLVKGSVDRRGHPFAGFAASSTLPPALMSPDFPIPAVDNANTFKLLPDPRYAVDAPARQNALVQLYSGAGGSNPFTQVLQSTQQGTMGSIDQLQKAHAAYKPAVEYPKDGFGNGLKLLAETITGDLGVKVGYITIGGFDTHSNQKANHARLLHVPLGRPAGLLGRPGGPGQGGQGDDHDLERVRAPGGGERVERHRPRHGHPAVHHRERDQGRALGRSGQPDGRGQGEPQVHHRLPLRVQHGDGRLAGRSRGEAPRGALPHPRLPRLRLRRLSR